MVLDCEIFACHRVKLWYLYLCVGGVWDAPGGVEQRRDGDEEGEQPHQHDHQTNLLLRPEHGGRS